MPFEASKLTNSVTVDLDCHAILNSLIQRRDLNDIYTWAQYHQHRSLQQRPLRIEREFLIIQ